MPNRILLVTRSKSGFHLFSYYNLYSRSSFKWARLKYLRLAEHNSHCTKYDSRTSQSSTITIQSINYVYMARQEIWESERRNALFSQKNMLNFSSMRFSLQNNTI